MDKGEANFMLEIDVASSPQTSSRRKDLEVAMSYTLGGFIHALV